MKISGKVWLGVLWVASASAHAQQGPDRKGEQVATSNPSARCLREVREYLDTMKFIRQAAGKQIGDRVAAGYLSEPEVEKALGERGPCPAAQLIKDRTASRASAS